MGKHINKTYPLRIDNNLRLKVEYIANIEDRKISQQYERIIRNFISEYEAENGELFVEEDGTVHPKQILTKDKSGKSSNYKVG
jgi:MoaA/NifB/PqqE/SkfB family radical SAM enzyme